METDVSSQYCAVNPQTTYASDTKVLPCLVDVSELDTDVDVNWPDVGASWICCHQVLKQCFSTFHGTVTELKLGKFADHLKLWKQVELHIQRLANITTLLDHWNNTRPVKTYHSSQKIILLKAEKSCEWLANSGFSFKMAVKMLVSK